MLTMGLVHREAPKKVLHEMPAKSLLNAKDRKFRLLYEENPQAMWLVDPRNQTILDANAAASKLYGYAREECRGLSLDRIESGETEKPEDGPNVGDGPLHPVVRRRHRVRGGRLIDVEMT